MAANPLLCFNSTKMNAKIKILKPGQLCTIVVHNTPTQKTKYICKVLKQRRCIYCDFCYTKCIKAPHFDILCSSPKYICRYALKIVKQYTYTYSNISIS